MFAKPLAAREKGVGHARDVELAVKAQAWAADPSWDSEERVNRRDAVREWMLASVGGAQLAEICR